MQLLWLAEADSSFCFFLYVFLFLRVCSQLSEKGKSVIPFYGLAAYFKSAASETGPGGYKEMSSILADQ